MLAEEYFTKKYYNPEVFRKVCFAVNSDIKDIDKKNIILFEKLSKSLSICRERNVIFNATCAFRDCIDEIVYLLTSKKVSAQVKSHILAIVFDSLIITVNHNRILEFSSLSFFEACHDCFFSKPNFLKKTKDTKINEYALCLGISGEEAFYRRQVAFVASLLRSHEDIFTFKFNNVLLIETFDFYLENFKRFLVVLIDYVNDIEYQPEPTSKKKRIDNPEEVSEEEDHSKNIPLKRNSKMIEINENCKFMTLDSSSEYVVIINRILDTFIFDNLTSNKSKYILKTTVIFKYIKDLTSVAKVIVKYCESGQKVKKIQTLLSVGRVIFSYVKVVCAYLSKYSISLDFEDIVSMSSTANSLFSLFVTQKLFVPEPFFNSDNKLPKNPFLLNVASQSLYPQVNEVDKDEFGQVNLFFATQKYLSDLEEWCKKQNIDNTKIKKKELYYKTLICDIKYVI